ncbi:MAG: cell division protein ZapB [Spirochaetaceae bacterium]|jgi:hypothetical protein|nr:cell division protein ZapB [Spirochaetaceae bacterium]
MVTLDQIKLLEAKVARTIEIVNQVTGENSYLKGKLETYQKRIDELEVLIQRFKEDQGRIEEGIMSTLDRLNKFEEAVEGGAREEPPAAEEPPPAKRPEPEPLHIVANDDTAPAAAYIPAEEDADDPLIFDEGDDTGDAALSNNSELDIF